VNAVIEYLGRHAVMHFGDTKESPESEDSERIKKVLEKLRVSAEFLNVQLPAEPDEDCVFTDGVLTEGALPGQSEETLAEKLCTAIDILREKELAALEEKQHIKEAYSETKAFSNLNAPFADLDQLSYLTLRVGRLDPKIQPEFKKQVGDRAVIIPLGEEGDNSVLAASSRRGRFALDSELKKHSFESIAVPKGYMGVPSEMIEGLEKKLEAIDKDINKMLEDKEKMREESQAELQRLGSVMLMALAVEGLKSQLVCTPSIYLLSGWIPQDMVAKINSDLSKITEGRTAIRAYTPNEIPEVLTGGEKVPVSLKHGAFVKGFEGVVISYGTPLYGCIDPTPIVAFFFTLLFGIMFGDLGQGFVLFLAGILTRRRGPFRRFGKFSTPLIAVGTASMVMGFLAGSVFTNEELLIAPTRALTAALTGTPSDRILTLMPLAEQGGSVTKLFYLFGFTIGIGVIFNSIGLILNIINRCVTKKYESAFFSKHGLAGVLLFWYAISIALRVIFFGGSFESFDLAGILVPLFFIFFGPVIWRCITREKPVFEHGFLTFFMEGFVEMLETASGYISNTVSFLRVGAFALSHAVLSYIVFRFTEELAHSGGIAGGTSAVLVFIFGNLVIIVLEGMIVAIQVIRLQYYEFFSKFFTDTGVEFSPFRFRKGVK
jgi:V/A-type H+-transporting ATPase subunit I